MVMVLGGSGTISSDKITVDANGKIGVGNINPQHALDVGGAGATSKYSRLGGMSIITADSDYEWWNGTYTTSAGPWELIRRKISDGTWTKYMGVDTNGCVTKPYQPSIRLDGNAGTATIGTGQHIISSYSVAHNIGMTHSSGRVTVPVAGVYAVSWNIYHYHTGHGRSGILVNGSLIGLCHTYTSTGTGDQTTGATIYISLSANDYLETAIMAGYPGNYYFGSQHTYFSVALLG